jgi:phosphoglycerate dehydrogenase-like enzyme
MIKSQERTLVHLHIDNYSPLGKVFQVNTERLQAALERHPQVAQRIRVTVETDNYNFEQHMATAEALIRWEIDVQGLGERAPHLRWIHSTGAGVEQFAPFDWLPERVTFTNNCGVHGSRADEYAIMAVLMLNNRVPEMVTHQRVGHWTQTFNTGIEDKTLLVVGVGHIGGGVAKWAKRFGMKVIGIRRTGKPHESVDSMYTTDALPDLIPSADFIIVCLPNTPNTRNLIG